MTGDRNDRDSEGHALVIDQLSSLIDDEMSDAERRSLEAHLATCAACRARLDEIRAVKTWLSSDVATAGDRAAPADWKRLRASLPARSIATGVGGWSRVSIAATQHVAVAASAAWWQTRDRGGSMPAGQFAAPSRASETAAVARLEALAQARLAAMPAPQSRALRASLQILDGAIADARSASVSEPDNECVATYLDDLLKRKADALRKVVEMADAERTS
jgi:anti-sigma factor RsiW